MTIARRQLNGKIAAIIGLVFVSMHSYGQADCDIRNDYRDFIRVERFTHDGRDFLVKRVSKADKESCFSGLVDNNLVFVDYLVTNFSLNPNQPHLLAITDSLALNDAFISDLQQDTLFNDLMAEWLAKTMENELPKDTLTMDGLLNIAVKYFSITGLDAEGGYRGKVCAGLNDIKKTEKERKPFVESFCFSSILKHYQGEEFSMHDEFVKSVRELFKVNLGIDDEEKLLRAQGAVFLLMRNNENLRKMLVYEYDRNKELLPFVLVD